MIGKRTASDLATIARNGGGFVLDGTRYSATDIAMIAKNMSEGSQLHVANSDGFATSDLSTIARNAVGAVVFS